MHTLVVFNVNNVCIGFYYVYEDRGVEDYRKQFEGRLDFFLYIMLALPVATRPVVHFDARAQ